MDYKKEGLKIAEKVIRAAVDDVVRPKLKEFILLSSNKYDDMLLPFIDDALDYVLAEFVDKIDGEVG